MLFLLLDLLRHNLEFKGAEFFDNYYLEIFPLSKAIKVGGDAKAAEFGIALIHIICIISKQDAVNVKRPRFMFRLCIEANRIVIIIVSRVVCNQQI